MDTTLTWHKETIGKKTVAALEKNRFKAEYLATGAEALKRALEIIPTGASVGVGGSVTLEEIGLVEELAKRGNKMILREGPGITPEIALSNRRAMLTADAFITSTNALTMDGQLVNIDGTGNRVAAITFGPKQVVIIAGINKVAADVNAAMERLEFLAAPANNKRLSLPNPCTTTGICMDCESPRRICNVTSIMHKKPSQSNITILLVGEELGY